MVSTPSRMAAIFVDRGCTEHWIVRDPEGRFWIVPILMAKVTDLASYLYRAISCRLSSIMRLTFARHESRITALRSVAARLTPFNGPAGPSPQDEAALVTVR